MPTFNYQKALDAGYTPEQIDAFVQKNNLEVKRVQSPVTGSDMQQTQTPTPQPEMQAPQNVKQPTFNERIGQGVLDIGNKLVQPFVRTGRNIAGGLVQAPLAIRAGDLANVVNDPNASDEAKDKALKELRRVNQLNKLLAPFAETGKATDAYKQDAGQVLSDPRVIKQTKDAINIASYGVPFGKGANFLTKATLPSMAVGAMQSASEDNATLPSVVGGALTSGVLGTAAYGASKIPSLIKNAGATTEKAGQKLIQSQYNLPRNVAKSLDLPATVQKLNEYGFNSIDDVANKADDVMSIIEKPIQSSVSKAKPVDLQGFTGAVKNIVDDPSIRVGQDEKIMGFVDKLIQKMTKGGKGSQLQLSGDPNGVLEVIRTLEKKASDVAKGKLPVAITDEERALKQAYRLIADELKDRLYTGAGADNLVAGEVGQVVDLLKKFSPKLADEVSKAKTVGELRSLMAPFVRGKIAAETTQFGQNLATETMGGAVKGLGKMAQNPLNILAVPLGSDVVSSKVGGATANIGRALSNTPQISQQISNVSANVASRLPNAYQPNNEAQNNQANPTQEQKSGDVQSQVNHNMGSIEQLTTSVKTDAKNTKGQTGYSYNELTRAFAKAMMDGDTKLANRIKPLMELEKDALPKDETGQGTATERMNKNRAMIGLRALSDAEKMLKDDPALLAKSLIPGKPFSRKYEASAVRTAEQILRMQTGATVTKEEARKYAQEFMPWFGDDPETIQYKLEQMRLDYEQFL